MRKSSRAGRTAVDSGRDNRVPELAVGRPISQEFYEANKSLSVRRSVVSTLLSIVGTLGYYAAYAVIIYLTVKGHRSAAGPFTIGVLTFLAGAELDQIRARD